MIPYLIALVGGYLIGESMQSETFADGGLAGDLFVVYYSVFRAGKKIPVLCYVFDSEEQAKNKITEISKKGEKWYYKPASALPVYSEIRLSSSDPNYKKLKSIVHSKGKVEDFFEGKDSFFKRNFGWVSYGDGGGVSAKEWQIKKKDGTYFYLKMSTGAPAWSTSADMGYQYTKDEAERLKSILEKDGLTDLTIVKYDKDWWKNAPEFADGGQTDRFEIKKVDGDKTYYYKIKITPGEELPFTDEWVVNSGDTFTKEMAERIKKNLEKQGVNGLSIVSQWDWTKFAQGGQVNPYEQFLLDNGFVKGYERKNKGFVQYRKGRWYCWIDNKTKEVEIGKYGDDVPVNEIDGWRENEPFYHTDRYTNSFSKFKKFLDDNYVLDFADGGKIKWQDVEVGDSANVKEINKTGVIVKTYGRKFHLKFVDGKEKTYDASELEFIKN